jgi:hypothetical protein
MSYFYAFGGKAAIKKHLWHRPNAFPTKQSGLAEFPARLSCSFCQSCQNVPSNFLFFTRFPGILLRSDSPFKFGIAISIKT